MSKKVKTGNERVRIVPLGGLEQIGMNITAFETEESIIVVELRTGIPGRRYVRSRSGNPGYHISAGQQR